MTIYKNNRQSGGSAAFQKMVVFTCDFETFCKLSKYIFFLYGGISGFSEKSMKFPNQRSVRYTPLVVRAGLEIARCKLGALWPIFPAATVRVEWRIRGLRAPDGHFEDCFVRDLAYYKAHCVL